MGKIWNSKKGIEPTNKWTFTVNNYTENDIAKLKRFEVSYITIGKEVGENGTNHLQGFVIWQRNYRLAGLKKLVPTAHWEPAVMSDAMNYCFKEDDEVYIKDNRRQGMRRDIDLAYDSMEKKLNNRGFLMLRPTLQAIKVFDILNFRLQPERDFKPLVTWVYGPTGVGKTRKIVEIEKDLWISNHELKWWDGYENQKAILLDDFRASCCEFVKLLRILDRYSMNVEIKGGYRVLNSARIYITSCSKPGRIYIDKQDEEIDQLLRRIDNIWYIAKENCFLTEKGQNVQDVVQEVQKGNTSSGLLDAATEVLPEGPPPSIAQPLLLGPPPQESPRSNV